MSRIIKVTAFLAANSFDLRKIRRVEVRKPTAESSSELFYATEDGLYFYYANYGVAILSGHSEEEMKKAVQSVLPYSKGALDNWLRDDFEVFVESGREVAFEFERLVLGALDENVMRIIMFNLGQSLAIDYYSSVAERLLTEVKVLTNRLAATGRLKIKSRSMTRFLGRALNTQNDIAENIYIFDTPDLVWDDEFLDKVHHGLVRHFDLRMRFRELEYMLGNIGNNLRTFSELSHHRESNLLEWIIIVLILLEVIDLLISKLT